MLAFLNYDILKLFEYFTHVCSVFWIIAPTTPLHQAISDRFMFAFFVVALGIFLPHKSASLSLIL